jgi:hypothetical protein
MNERIKQLFKQAGGHTSVRNLASNPVQVVETHELWDDHIEKFAELIVKECAMIVEGFEFTYEAGLDEYVDYEASSVLKEHFGIEQ